MFEEFERVRIKGTDVIGDIIDITDHDGKNIYLVESDDYGPISDSEVIKKFDVYNHGYPLYSCTADQLEHI